MISEEDLNTLKSLHEHFIDEKSHDENIINCEIIEKLNCALEKLIDRLGESSRTAKLWIQYIRYIDIVKYFIAAERTGNWQNHLESTAKMLNLFATTGHSNYAKSARLYLQMMKELPTILYEQFTHNGYHTVRRSNRFWSGIWTDLAIEQALMRLLKTRGGLTRGRGMTENVILIWDHTMHACAQVHNAMTQLTGNHHKTSNPDAELVASRIKRDNENLENIKLWIENHNPFDDNEPLLTSIATGLTATEGDGINCDEAEKNGQAIQDQLDDISITETTIKKKKIRLKH